MIVRWITKANVSLLSFRLSESLGTKKDFHTIYIVRRTFDSVRDPSEPEELVLYPHVHSSSGTRQRSPQRTWISCALSSRSLWGWETQLFPKETNRWRWQFKEYSVSYSNTCRVLLSCYSSLSGTRLDTGWSRSFLPHGPSWTRPLVACHSDTIHRTTRTDWRRRRATRRQTDRHSFSTFFWNPCGMRRDASVYGSQSIVFASFIVWLILTLFLHMASHTSCICTIDETRVERLCVRDENVSQREVSVALRL